MPRRTQPATPAYRWAFFAVISLGLFMVSLDNSILFTALPAINEQLRTTPTQALWIINAYPLVLSGLLLGTGTLGDRIGHRFMFMLGLIFFGLASLGAAFAPSAWVLVIARGVLGVGGACMMPATLALISHTFPDEQERNTAIGIWSAVAVIGSALGPVVGGALLQTFWWGSIFLINAPVALVALVLTGLLAPPNRPNRAKHWDATSSVYSLIALTGMTLAIKETANPERSPALLAFALAAAIAGAVAFARRQDRLADPLLTFDVFRSRMFAGGVLAAMGSMFVLTGTELQTTQKLQLVDAFTPLQAGLAIIAMALAAFPASVLGGAKLHRVGFLPLIAGGFAGGALGALLLALGSAAGSFPLEILGLAVEGFAGGAVMSVASIAIIGAAPPHRSGMAAGVEEVSYEFGSLITVAITGSLFNRWLEEGLNSAAAYETAYKAAYETVYETVHAGAYHSVLLLVAAVSAAFAVTTWWCFRDNPKSGVASGV